MEWQLIYWDWAKKDKKDIARICKCFSQEEKTVTCAQPFLETNILKLTGQGWKNSIWIGILIISLRWLVVNVLITFRNTSRISVGLLSSHNTKGNEWQRSGVCILLHSQLMHLQKNLIYLLRSFLLLGIRNGVFTRFTRFVRQTSTSKIFSNKLFLFWRFLSNIMYSAKCISSWA